MQEGLGSSYALPYRMRKEAQSGDEASPGPHDKIHPWLSPAGRGLGCHLHHTLHYSVCVCACLHARARSHPAGCEDLGLHTSSLAPSRCLAPWLNRRALVYQAPTVC